MENIAYWKLDLKFVGMNLTLIFGFGLQRSCDQVIPRAASVRAYYSRRDAL